LSKVASDIYCVVFSNIRRLGSRFIGVSSLYLLIRGVDLVRDVALLLLVYRCTMLLLLPSRC
jgi:hypothetical protein